MSDRLKGSLLLATGVLVLGGVSNGSLPILSFWLGLILYPIGGYLFLKGNRKAGEELERQVQRALNPTIRSQTAAAFAKQQAERPGDGFSPPARSMPVASPHAHNESGVPRQPSHHEILLEEREIDSGELELDVVYDSHDDLAFKVSEDVSFPVEVQERRQIADELRKLIRLFEDGSLSEAELNAAKAKLLR